MRDYGTVSPQFWIGRTGKSLRGNVAAQLVALYLMTSPHANMIGVFYCTLDTIAKETGLEMEGASKGLQSLIEAKFCQFDADTEEVFVKRMAAFQIGEQLEPKDNRCKGVARELEKVMSDGLKSAFRAIYSVAFHLPKPAKKQPAAPSVDEAPSKPLRSQEQEQEHGQDQDHSAKAGGKPPDEPIGDKRSDPVKQEIWGTGRAVLRVTGESEKDLGKFLGKLVNDYTPGIVLDAVRATAATLPDNPKEYLQACCARAMGKRKGPTRASKHTGFQNFDYTEGVTNGTPDA
jgi:hypothetical protein